MTPVIEVTGLTKRYAGQAVVDRISFHVERGEIFGILGPNGAGKTTAVECMEGLRRRDAGQIRILGLDPKTDGHRLHQMLGVQLQETQLRDKIKVREALELYASFYPDPADWRGLLDRWGLAGKRDTRFGKLSGGQKQRLFIALALVGNPEVVFLDELTAGLDPGARRATWDLIAQIRDSGVTVVLVSHFMDEVEELCDRVAILERGRIAALDTPAGLVDSAGGEYDVRVLVLTTFDTDTDVLPAIEAGATGYLLKDSPPEELRRGVRAAARGEAVLSPSVATRLVGQVREPAREPLSQRELDILGLISRGCSNREAAARLFISEATVKTHVLHIYAKLGVNDRAAAVAAGFERGLLPRPLKPSAPVPARAPDLVVIAGRGLPGEDLTDLACDVIRVPVKHRL